MAIALTRTSLFSAPAPRPMPTLARERPPCVQCTVCACLVHAELNVTFGGEMGMATGAMSEELRAGWAGCSYWSHGAPGAWWNVTNDPYIEGQQSPLWAFTSERALNRLALRTKLTIVHV